MEANITKFIKEASGKIHELYNVECAPDPSSMAETGRNRPPKIFASRYKIRALLSGLANTVKRIDPLLTNARSALLWGYLILKIAINYIETEEPGEGRCKLRELLEYLRTRQDLRAAFEALDDGDSQASALDESSLTTFSGLLQLCFNSLGVISSPSSCDDTDGQKKQENESALSWLLKAQLVYQMHQRVCTAAASKAPECWESLGFFHQLEGSGEDAMRLMREIMFETGYTTTVFMLAQVCIYDSQILSIV